ncbi:MAG: hydantoinase/oxoprolinase family protein [bacterium]
MEKITAVGWDIGGANIKASRIVYNKNQQKIEEIKSISRYFPMWDNSRDPLPLIKEMNQELNSADFFGITMTAELADRFQNKTDGINVVINLFADNFKKEELYFYNNQAEALSLNNLKNIESLAAANWAVSAAFVSEFCADFILFDMGSTSTDLIPVVDSKIKAAGRTDLERLNSGELFYWGYLRSNLAFLIDKLPYQGKMIDILNEYFASSADLHLLKGLISQAEYTVPAADGGSRDKKGAARRISRLLSLDLNTIKMEELNLIVEYIYQLELSKIFAKLLQVYSRVDPGFKLPVLANHGAYKYAADLRSKKNIQILNLESEIGLLKNNILSTTAAAYMLLKKLK